MGERCGRPWAGSIPWPGYNLSEDQDAYFYQPGDVHFDFSSDPVGLACERRDKQKYVWDASTEDQKTIYAFNPHLLWREADKLYLRPMGPSFQGALPAGLAALAQLNPDQAVVMNEKLDESYLAESVPDELVFGTAGSVSAVAEAAGLGEDVSAAPSRAGSVAGEVASATEEAPGGVALSTEVASPEEHAEAEPAALGSPGATDQSLDVNLGDSDAEMGSVLSATDLQREQPGHGMSTVGEESSESDVVPQPPDHASTGRAFKIDRCGLLFDGLHLGASLPTLMLSLGEHRIRKQFSEYMAVHSLRVKAMRTAKQPVVQGQTLMVGNAKIAMNTVALSRMDQIEELRHLFDTEDYVESLFPAWSDITGGEAMIVDPSAYPFTDPIYTSSIKEEGGDVELVKEHVYPAVSINEVEFGMEALTVDDVQPKTFRDWADTSIRLSVATLQDTVPRSLEEFDFSGRAANYECTRTDVTRDEAVTQAALPNAVVMASQHPLDSRIDASPAKGTAAFLNQLPLVVPAPGIPSFPAFRLFWEGLGRYEESQRELQHATMMLNAEHDMLSALYYGLKGTAASGSIYQVLRERKVKVPVTLLYGSGLDTECLDDLDASLDMIAEVHVVGEELGKILEGRGRVDFETALVHRMNDIRKERNLAFFGVADPVFRRFWDEERKWIGVQIPAVLDSAQITGIPGGFTGEDLMNWDIPIPVPPEVGALGREAYFNLYLAQVDVVVPDDHGMSDSELPLRYMYRGVRFPRPDWEWDRVERSVKAMLLQILSGPTKDTQLSNVDVAWLKYALSKAPDPLKMLSSIVEHLWTLCEEEQVTEAKKALKLSRIRQANRIAGAIRRFQAGSLLTASATQRTKDSERLRKFRSAGENQLIYHTLKSMGQGVGTKAGSLVMGAYQKMAATVRLRPIMQESLEEVEPAPSIAAGHELIIHELLGVPYNLEGDSDAFRLTQQALETVTDTPMRFYLQHLRDRMVEAGIWSSMVPMFPAGATQEGRSTTSPAPEVVEDLPKWLREQIRAHATFGHGPTYDRLVLTGLQEVSEEIIRTDGALAARLARRGAEQRSIEEWLIDWRPLGRREETGVDPLQFISHHDSLRRQPVPIRLKASGVAPLGELHEEWLWRMMRWKAGGNTENPPCPPTNVDLLDQYYANLILMARPACDWVDCLLVHRVPMTLEEVKEQMKEALEAEKERRLAAAAIRALGSGQRPTEGESGVSSDDDDDDPDPSEVGVNDGVERARQGAPSGHPPTPLMARRDPAGRGGDDISEEPAAGPRVAAGTEDAGEESDSSTSTLQGEPVEEARATEIPSTSAPTTIPSASAMPPAPGFPGDSSLGSIRSQDLDVSSSGLSGVEAALSSLAEVLPEVSAESVSQVVQESIPTTRVTTPSSFSRSTTNKPVQVSESPGSQAVPMTMADISEAESMPDLEESPPRAVVRPQGSGAGTSGTSYQPFPRPPRQVTSRQPCTTDFPHMHRVCRVTREGDEVYECARCGELYSTFRNVLNHAREMHRVHGKVCDTHGCYFHIRDDSSFARHLLDHFEDKLRNVSFFEIPAGTTYTLSDPVAPPPAASGRDPLSSPPGMLMSPLAQVVQPSTEGATTTEVAPVAQIHPSVAQVAQLQITVVSTVVGPRIISKPVVSVPAAGVAVVSTTQAWGSLVSPQSGAATTTSASKPVGSVKPSAGATPTPGSSQQRPVAPPRSTGARPPLPPKPKTGSGVAPATATGSGVSTEAQVPGQPAKAPAAPKKPTPRKPKATTPKGDKPAAEGEEEESPSRPQVIGKGAMVARTGTWKGRQLICDMCQSSYTTEHSFQRHTCSGKRDKKGGLGKGGPQVYYCTQCDKAFSRSDTMLRHFDVYHPGLPRPSREERQRRDAAKRQEADRVLQANLLRVAQELGQLVTVSGGILRPVTTAQGVTATQSSATSTATAVTVSSSAVVTTTTTTGQGTQAPPTTTSK